MVRRISWALAVGLVVILGGCADVGAVPTHTPAPAPAARSYTEPITRWLSGVPCRAPCWEGITPGVSTKDQAFDLLGARQFIDLPRFPSAQAAAEINWKWVGAEYGSGDLRTSDGTVSMILLNLPQEVILRDVIAAYGEPSHIVAVTFMGLHGDGPFYILSLAWEPAGFALAKAALYHEKPVLSADLPFDLLYFSPSPEIIIPGLRAQHALQPWQGFKDFDAYCRNDQLRPCS